VAGKPFFHADGSIGEPSSAASEAEVSAALSEFNRLPLPSNSSLNYALLGILDELEGMLAGNKRK